MPKPTVEIIEANKNLLRDLIMNTGSESPSLLKRKMQEYGSNLSRFTIRSYIKQFHNETKTAEIQSQLRNPMIPKQEKLIIEKQNKKILKKDINKPIYKNGKLINDKILSPNCPNCNRQFLMPRFNKNQSVICVSCGFELVRPLNKWVRIKDKNAETTLYSL